MKRTLPAVLATAVLIGTASTTFAAANPFSDVPQSHWSYQAVAELASQGVIEGYGDNTFRGDAHITRYEMAQMVAKAMAKEEAVDAQTKATLDKLAAEYSKELENLGVRVQKLEEKVDNVTWGGKIQFRTESDESVANSQGHSRSRTYYDIIAKAKVNDDWKAAIEFLGARDMHGHSFVATGTGAYYDYGDKNEYRSNVWVEGNVQGAKVKAGKFTSNSFQKFVLGDKMRGFEVNFGDKDKLQTQLTYGRVGANDDWYFSGRWETTADYRAIEFRYPTSKATTIAAGYHEVDSLQLANGYMSTAPNGSTGYVKPWYPSDHQNTKIWTVGFDTKLSDNFRLGAIYAKSNQDVDHDGNSIEDDGHSVTLTYKETNVKDPGSYKIWIRHNKVPLSTRISCMDLRGWNTEGMEYGIGYVPAENVYAYFAFHDGKQINGGTNIHGDVNGDFIKKRFQVEFYF